MRGKESAESSCSSPAACRAGAGTATLLAAGLLLAGCSVRGLAINALARSLAASGDVFASDEDPELIRAATPFALKTMESLLAEKPDHPGLLLAACKGFTQYGYAFVESDAELLEESDWEAAERESERALKLYLRGRDYCLRALEGVSEGVRGRLESEPGTRLATFGREHVELLFWSAASWGAAISLGKDRPEISVDLPAVRALIERVLELDEGWDGGAAHEVMMVLEALPETMGGSAERARRHFERAVELSRGLKASPYVGLAESVSVQEQDRAEFERLLGEALTVDPDRDPPRRLANLIARRRAERLLARADLLFLEPLEEMEE